MLRTLCVFSVMLFLISLLWLCSSFAVTSLPTSQEPAAPATSPPVEAKDITPYTPQLRTKVRDLERWLSRDLVGTTPYGRWLIAGGPRFADVLREPLVGLGLRMRYGLTPVSSVGFVLSSFLRNPFAEHAGVNAGLGDVLLETKYRLPTWDALHLESALHLQLQIPLSEDDDHSDGVVHVTPSIIFLHPLLVSQPLHVYTRLGIDIATDNIDRTPIRDEIQESFWIAVIGMIYSAPPAMLFVDLEWQTNAAIGEGERNNLLIMPGIRYELPPIAWFPALVNIDLGVRIGIADALGRFDTGIRFTFDPKKSTY